MYSFKHVFFRCNHGTGLDLNKLYNQTVKKYFDCIVLQSCIVT